MYRLSAARLAILRLRFTRRWHRMFRSSPSSARTTILGGLMAVAILIAVAGSAWLGYRVGQLAKVDATVPAIPAMTAATRQIVGQKTPAALAAERPAVPTPAAASVPVIPLVPESERVDGQAQSARLAELANLRKTVVELEAQVQALEQEATGLEVELLDQQVAFTEAEARWKEASVERRVVYNITNIPVGSFVSEERIESDAEPAEFPPLENDFDDQTGSVDIYQQYEDSDGTVERWNGDAYLADVLEQQSTDANVEDVIQTEAASDQTTGGRVGRSSLREPTVPTGLPTDTQTHQELFFGPAQDLSDDWIDQ